MKSRYWRWLALIGTGGIVLQATTTSCSDQLVEGAASLLVTVFLQFILGALFGTGI